MKNIFITSSIIIFMILSLNLKAQEYYPMEKEGAHWIEGIESEAGMGQLEFLWEHHINGDTLINGENYKKVYRRDLILTESQAPPFEGAEPYYLVAVIRDDAVNRKVYAIVFEEYINGDCPLNEEYVLYDFSLEINESIDFCTYQGYGDDVLTNIIEGSDSRDYVSNTGLYFTEGIGGENGLFEGIFTPLMPLKNSNYIPYPKLIDYCPYNDCVFILSNSNIPNAQQLKIYPNPAKDFVVFKLPNNMSTISLKVFDISGKLIKELVTNENEVQWDCQNTVAGIYFYSTQIGNIIYNGKVIIK